MLRSYYEGKLLEVRAFLSPCALSSAGRRMILPLVRAGLPSPLPPPSALAYTAPVSLSLSLSPSLPLRLARPSRSLREGGCRLQPALQGAERGRGLLQALLHPPHGHGLRAEGRHARVRLPGLQGTWEERRAPASAMPGPVCGGGPLGMRPAVRPAIDGPLPVSVTVPLRPASASPSPLAPLTCSSPPVRGELRLGRCAGHGERLSSSLFWLRGQWACVAHF